MIHNKSNSSAIKVFLFSKKDIKKSPKKNNLKLLKFEGNYKQTAFLSESKEFYIGLDLKSEVKTSDPFFALDYFELGAIVAKRIKAIEPQKFQIEEFPLEKKKEDTQKNLHNFLLGALQGAHEFNKYLEKKKDSYKIIISLKKDYLKFLDQEILTSVKALDHALSVARDQIEETPEDLNPTSIVSIVKEEFKNNKNVEIDVFGKAELEAMGMNGVLAVGRASIHEPNMIHLKIKPKGKVKKKICLIGKGLTYDSGGLDIKYGGHMKGMKVDMAGSATMFGVARALADIELENTEVHWISAYVENMIDNNAYKADDIITSYSGQTVEVVNTDAEGRLTLMDVLAYSTLQNPDYIVDTATLTGAAVFSLSPYYAAEMGNDKRLQDKIEKSFLEEGELIVQTTMPEILRKDLKGKISDLTNITSNREAGHLTAGLFLSHFVDQHKFRNPKLKIKRPKAFPWVHLDIAGSASNEGKNKLGVKGATGHAIRGFVNWVLKVDR